MKIRLITLLLFLSLALAACASAGDITPPPGYQSPTPGQTQIPATETSAPARTSEPPTPTVESTPATPEAATPTGELGATSADVTAIPVISLGNITGSVANGSGGEIPAGQKVQLVGYDQDQSGTYQKVLDLETPAKSDGTYSFTDVEMPLGRAFLVVVGLGGVQYESEPIMVVDGSFDYSGKVTIYDTTDDLKALQSDSVKIYLVFDTAGIVQVVQEYRITNPGLQAAVVTTNGSSIPFISIPEGASSVAFNLTSDSAAITSASNGFAMIPGADKQYGFVASFTLPYESRLAFSQLFTQPVTALDVYVENGIRLKSSQLTKAAPETYQGIVFNHYQESDLPAASSISMTLSGKLGASTGFKFDRQTLILIGIGVVGLLLIGLGIFLFLRDRARLKEDEEEVREDGDDRNSIMDAIITLDDQYKTGEIPKEAYEKRREDLKKRLEE